MNPLSEPCGRHSRRSGQPCRILVIGGGPCRMHGGAAPQVKARRLQRVALAEAAARGRRDPWAVLADVTATADELFKRARAEVATNHATAETMAALIERMDQAGRFAKQLIDSGHQEREVRVAELQGQHIAATVGRILDRLGLTAEQRGLVPTVVPEELRRQGRLAIEDGAA